MMAADQGIARVASGPDLEAARRTPEAERELSRLRKASRDVEALFLKMLVGQLRKGNPKGLLGGGMEARVYADLFDEAVAAKMAEGRGVGIARLLYTQMEEAILRRVAAREMLPKPARGEEAREAGGIPRQEERR